MQKLQILIDMQNDSDGSKIGKTKKKKQTKKQKKNWT